MIRIARAVRCIVPTTISTEVECFTRIILEKDRVVLLQANASASGFDAISPHLSYQMLDAAEQAWRRESNLDVVFRAAEQLLPPPTATYEGAAGSLIAVVLMRCALTIRWIGEFEAWLVDGQGVKDRAESHTWARQMVCADAPKIVTRVLGQSVSRNTPDERNMIANPSDRLLVLGGDVLRAFSEAEIVRRGTSEDEAHAADTLLRVEHGNRGAYAAAIVVGGFE